jgi:hypothetical protein
MLLLAFNGLHLKISTEVVAVHKITRKENRKGMPLFYLCFYYFILGGCPD